MIVKTSNDGIAGNGSFKIKKQLWIDTRDRTTNQIFEKH